MAEPARQRPIGNPGIATVIVGTKFRGRAALDAITRMCPGEEVQLRRSTEPDVLKRDKHAVECRYAGIFVGYLSRTVTPPVARAFAEGAAPTAIIVEPGQLRRGWVKKEARIIVRWG